MSGDSQSEGPEGRRQRLITHRTVTIRLTVPICAFNPSIPVSSAISRIFFLVGDQSKGASIVDF